MTVAWCTVADVEAILDTTVDPDRCNALIDLASELAQGYCAGRYDTAATDPPPGVRPVVASMTARVYSNPEGIRQETTGLYSYSRDAGGVGFALTDADKAALDDVLPRVAVYDVWTPAAGQTYPYPAYPWWVCEEVPGVP